VILLVTGSRHGHPHVVAMLDRWAAKYGAPELVIVGDADGVDRTALEWSIDHHHFFVAFTADWQRHGKGAGPVRNCKMCVLASVGAHCVGFPVGDSPGTRGCMQIADRTGLVVYVVDQHGRPQRYTD
jgi:hypothetical protein